MLIQNIFLSVFGHEETAGAGDETGKIRVPSSAVQSSHVIIIKLF